MRVQKRIAISIIAILICMAFVLDFGSVFALVSYSFIGKSKATTTQIESYTEYSGVTSGTSGEYAFALGSVNNKLSINYGTNSNLDLMVRFTASYANSSHKASDFDLNFVGRDNWSIDLPSTTTLSNATSQTVYSLSSNTNTLSGTMYYLGKISGSGALDLISGVTFYNNGIQAGDFAGDVLTVTFTTYYVKSNSANYKLSTESPTHTFYTNSLSGTNYLAYDNWVKYMKSTTEYVAEASYMVYNAYANHTYALAYPSDFAWTADFDLAEQTDPEYSNTGYRYKITKTSTGNTRVLEGVAAGNRFRGGLGVFVFPSQRSKVKVTVSAFWEKDGVIQGTMPNNAIHLGLSGDLNGERYSEDITRPTYINILDYIMLTAEAGYKEALINGCKLVISNVTVEIEASTSGTQHANSAYQLNNATEKTPILARYKDIAASAMTQQVKLSVSNHSSAAMKINSFTIKGKLWYAGYTEQTMGETTFQVYEQKTKGHLGAGNIIYDTNLWTASTSGETITFTAKNNTFSNYVAAGYEMPLINGVTIPSQSSDLTQLTEVGDEIYVHDLWCTLEVSITSYSEVSTFSTSGANSAVEVVTTSYDKMTAANGYAYIYLRNNTNQTITSVSMSNLTLAQVTSTTGDPRKHMNASASFSYELMAFGGKAQYVSSSGALSASAPSSSPSSSTNLTVTSVSTNIKPNDYVLMFRIKPSQNAVVYSYTVSAQMSSGQANLTAHLLTDDSQGGVNLINNSTTKYEFRIKSNASLSPYLANSADFVLNQSGDNYYAYYLGVINENQIIKIASSLQGGVAVEVELIAHTDGAQASQYVASNYSTWSPPTAWLTGMQNIYKLLDASNM